MKLYELMKQMGLAKGSYKIEAVKHLGRVTHAIKPVLSIIFIVTTRVYLSHFRVTNAAIPTTFHQFTRIQFITTK